MFPFCLICRTKNKASVVTVQKKEVGIQTPHVPSDELFLIPWQFPAGGHVSFNSYIQLSCWRDKLQDHSQWVNNAEKELYSSIRKNFLTIGAVKQAEQRMTALWGGRATQRGCIKYLFEMLWGSDTQAWASWVSDLIICSNENLHF